MRGRGTSVLAAAAAAVAIAAAIVAVASRDGEQSPSGAHPVAADPAFDPALIFERASPGVVTVLASLPDGDEPLLPGTSQGSGFVLSSDGEVATNAHVVTSGEGEGLRPADDVYVDFADGNRVEAEVVGVDPNADVALLRIDAEGLELRPLELASSLELEVGAPVAAIGSPFGEEQSLSVGVISATDRSVESLTAFRIDGAIQTDAAINRGNSGGPLLDADSRVIGLNQQIRTASGGGEGVGFAVPIDAAKRSIDALRGGGRATYAFLGVSSQALYPQLAERLGLDVDFGALVAEVSEGGPAAGAGIRGGERRVRFQGQEVRIGGDVIVSVDGKALRREADLPRAIAARRPGDVVTLRIIRDRKLHGVRVRLAERPRELD